MSHKFIDTIKSDVKYCINCSCLSYRNIPTKGILFKNFNIIKIDPLILKYRPISLKLKLSSISHINYIAHRKIGLLKIYEISKKFDLAKVIIFKSIGLMDKIFLDNENEFFVEHLEKIALTCILLSFQFNNYNISEKNTQTYINNSIINRINKSKNRIFECYKYIKSELRDLIYWQSFCLNLLCFNLNEFTAYDYINLFFHLGIVFSKENIDIYNIYKRCLNMLEIVINNDKICKYNQYVVALSLIYINFNNEKAFSKSIFKYIYGVDFNKKKYKFCSIEIKEMINGFYNNIYCNHILINKRFINSIYKTNIFKNFEIISLYQKNVNSEMNNILEFNIPNYLKNTIDMFNGKF